MTKFVFVDVEALGKAPVVGKMTEFGAVEFRSEDTFYGKLIDSEPDPTNPAVPRIKIGAHYYDPVEVLLDFKSWLEGFNDRLVFVSDNPAYDYQWINDFFIRYGYDNPFGHSARRIGDFYAGLRQDWHRTSDWKRFRVTKHTHHPVDDAMGNVEAVKYLEKHYGFKIK